MIQNAFWNCKDDPSSATHSWNTKWESDSSLKTKANVINKFYYYITMLPEIKHSNWLKLCDLKHPIRLLQIIVMQCNYLFVTSTTVCRWSESVKKYMSMAQRKFVSRGQPGFETQRMGNLWIHTNGDIYLTEDALAHLNNRRCQLWSSLVEIDQLK